MNQKIFCKSIAFGICLTLLSACSQKGTRVDLGNLKSGATVSFVRATGGQWGIEITEGTTPKLMQQKPAQIEVYKDKDNLLQLAAGYKSVKKEMDTIIARVKLATKAGANLLSRTVGIFQVMSCRSIEKLR